MGTEHTILGQTTEIIRLLRALDLGKKPAPTVDFAVDMFDRQDQNTLGDYWSAGGHGIRGGMAVCVSGTGGSTAVVATCSATASAYYHNGVVSASVSGSSNAYGLSDNIVESVYSGVLTTSDFSCQVMLLAAAYPGGADIGSDSKDGSYYSNGKFFGSGHVDVFGSMSGGVSNQIASNGGVCVADNSNTATAGIAMSAYHVPSMSAIANADNVNQYGATSNATAETSNPGGDMCLVRYGSSVASVVTPDRLAVNNSASDLGFVETYNTTANVVASYTAAVPGLALIGGINTLKAHCLGESVWLTINGVVIFSGAPASVPQKNRLRAGIMTPASNIAAAGIVDPTLPIGGIISFKVWRNDIPEPPNQTGHGTYKDGKWHYADKYHTPIEDAEGNITGYTYDPEA